MGKIPVLISCQDDYCAAEVSYTLDMMRMFLRGPICQACYEDGEYGPRDDDGALVTDWDDLPSVKLTDLDLPEPTP